MKFAEFEVTRTVNLAYDENSPEFKQALEGFQADISTDATAEKMLQHVAYNLQNWGDHVRMVEGVGYVNLIGTERPERNWSGISVNPNYDRQHID